ncbi:hypothetical protein BU16DRAFT_554010 [Lophium mytilinum]|uniref:BTB domain-containing protein n=1 Tax=Lophium mytilinum TaxID=390894 RepID=A0A6A6RDY5_9PEZI|nr:hypothetical protein BU16DRAFT_554010 [Lophium mytilinum]
MAPGIVFNDPKLSDVILRVKNENSQKDYYAHRVVLCWATNYFEATFLNNFKEANADTVEVYEDSPAIFEIMLKCIYEREGDYTRHLTHGTDEPQLDYMTRLVEIFQMADKYLFEKVQTQAADKFGIVAGSFLKEAKETLHGRSVIDSFWGIVRYFYANEVSKKSEMGRTMAMVVLALLLLLHAPYNHTNQRHMAEINQGNMAEIIHESRFSPDAGFSDVMLRVHYPGREPDGAFDEYKAHRVILCQQSMWFERALKGSFKEASTQVIDIHEDDPSVFNCMLQFMYERHYKLRSVEDAIAKIGPSVSKEDLKAMTLNTHIDTYNMAQKYLNDGLQAFRALAFTSAALSIRPSSSGLRAHIYKEGIDQQCKALARAVERFYETALATNTNMGRAIAAAAWQSALVDEERFDELINEYPAFAVDVLLEAKKGRQPSKDYESSGDPGSSAEPNSDLNTRVAALDSRLRMPRHREYTLTRILGVPKAPTKSLFRSGSGASISPNLHILNKSAWGREMAALNSPRDSDSPNTTRAAVSSVVILAGA